MWITLWLPLPHRLKDGVLYYYSTSSDSEPINWIPLDSATVIKCDEEDALKFKLTTGNGRKYSLSTPPISARVGMDDNGLAREQWVKAIYGVVKIHCEALGVEPSLDPFAVLTDAKKLREKIDQVRRLVTPVSGTSHCAYAMSHRAPNMPPVACHC